MERFFYLIVDEYPSIKLAEVAVYFFLQKYCLYNDEIIIVHNELSAEDKSAFSKLYYKVSFKKTDKFVCENGKNMREFDWQLAPESIQANTKIINEYEEWKVAYKFNEDKSFPKNLSDSEKYIVCTCAKGENEYIVEWVEHYLNLGFDKIIICDNNDDNSLRPVIAKFVNRGAVEVFNCHGFAKFQERMYQMFCEEGNYKWCAYFDCDEFLELGVYSSIKDYLAAKSEDCVAFNWVLFGSDGQLDKKQGKLSERFKVPYLPLLNLYNGFVKGIVRGGRFRFRHIDFKGGHLPYPKDTNFQLNTYSIGGYSSVNIAPYQTAYPLRYREGYLKHYYTKSFEEWIDKAKRGWPISMDSLPFERYFFLESPFKADRKLYEKNLFLKDEWFKTRTKSVLDFLSDNKMAEIAHEICSVYGFVSFLLYVMSQVSGKVLFIKSETLDDFLFGKLLECAFITDNKIVYCKDDNEVNMAYNKYKDAENLIYFWEVI